MRLGVSSTAVYSSAAVRPAGTAALLTGPAGRSPATSCDRARTVPPEIEAQLEFEVKTGPESGSSRRLLLDNDASAHARAVGSREAAPGWLLSHEHPSLHEALLVLTTTRPLRPRLLCRVKGVHEDRATSCGGTVDDRPDAGAAGGYMSSTTPRTGPLSQ
eukprot:GHVU01119563.1.p1 GENE.GHVU01119563.1~~GHVU01119563.1.p1  ORF type:complete len:160 (-),score=18.83 GHVU01119563.1:75-554(-)